MQIAFVKVVKELDVKGYTLKKYSTSGYTVNGVRFKNLSEVKEWAKTAPEQINYGVGTLSYGVIASGLELSEARVILNSYDASVLEDADDQAVIFRLGIDGGGAAIESRRFD